MEKDTQKSREASDSNQISDAEWENRVLCPDGNCIGVIGPDGRCTECGMVYDANQPQKDAAIKTEESAPEELDEPVHEDSPATDADASETVVEQDEFVHDNDWADRTLCSDGDCIGVIGPDGCCKECGKEYDPVDDLSGAA